MSDDYIPSLTESDCRELLNSQPSWNLGPFAMLNLGYRAGYRAGLGERDAALELLRQAQNYVDASEGINATKVSRAIDALLAKVSTAAPDAANGDKA